MKKRFYLYKSGTFKRQDNSIIYITSTDKIYIPIFQIELIFVFGSCNLNKDFLKLISSYGICIYFFDYYGNYFGSFLPKNIYNGQSIVNQVNFINNHNKMFIIKKEIIITSIVNMLSVIKYYNKKNPIFADAILNLENNIDKLTALSIDKESSLLIYEASSKKEYYAQFNKIIKNSAFIFKGRSVNPPLDEVNAVMSYGYAILYGIIENTLYRAKLEPSLAFIHGISKTKNGLQYDIADIFKPFLIDRLIFRMINKKQLLVSHFNVKTDRVYLNKDGINIFISELEENLKKVIKISDNKILSYRSIISREVHKIKLCINNESDYCGFRMRW